MLTIKKLMNLRGRRALITGAAGCLGQVIAHTLGELGADLVLLDRPGTDFTFLEKDLISKWGVKVKLLLCDLEIEADRLKIINNVRDDGVGLSILINNAAFLGATDLQGWVAPFEQQTVETWRRAIEVNLTAAFHLSQGFASLLKASDNGSVINITSIYGEYGPDWRLYEGTAMGNPAAYGVSKGGLVQLTRWLATTIAPSVRVNAISPGGVIRNQPRVFQNRYIERTPLGRMATEDDFRGAIAYLASDLSNYVTGQILRVDGGWGEW
jgi:NAD(P)-dependent dehydrogenase (short-subunit alcohol dehydrogenase family)